MSEEYNVYIYEDTKDDKIYFGDSTGKSVGWLELKAYNEFKKRLSDAVFDEIMTETKPFLEVLERCVTNPYLKDSAEEACRIAKEAHYKDGREL